MVEIIEATPGKRKVYAALKALAREWDGSGPVRQVADFADIITTTE